MDKRNDGRDEPIIDPARPIIDSHHHLLVRPNARYLLDEFLADAGAGHNVVASVYVETQAMARPGGPEPLRPLGEVEFANGSAAMAASGAFGSCRACAAIVAHARLTAGDPVAEYLDRALALAPDRLRGVRQMTFWHPSETLTFRFPEGILGSAAFRDGFRHLQPRGLSFDATVFHNQLGELAALADAFPDTAIVLNHAGMAMGLGLDEAGRAALRPVWQAALTDLARRPNVVCKVGGMGLAFWGFGFESRPGPVGSAELAAAWQPYVDGALAAFGPGRCMAESDFPMDGVACGYVPAWNALKLATAALSDTEKAALFHDTAARVYRIPTA